jgi:multidrug resistance protein MdtO
MTALADPQGSRPSFIELLAVELAPREGRWAAVARIVTGSVITVIIAMVFQIPQPTYMAYIVFLLSKDEQNATVTSALGALIACTFAILVVLGLELIDTSEPALRVPLMAMSTFVAMFTVRTFALGPISFLAGFIIVLVQSLVDDIPNPEALTRATLWLWVVLQHSWIAACAESSSSARPRLPEETSVDAWPNGEHDSSHCSRLPSMPRGRRREQVRSR